MSNPGARALTLAVPATLLVYAACRAIDGRDGHRGPGLWWDIGHVAFLTTWAAFLLLSMIMGAHLLDRSRMVAIVATISSACGSGLFGWVVLHDLQVLPALSDALKQIGPLLFIVGFCVLLGHTARAARVRRWWWFPVLAVLAVALVAAELALLPLTAVCFLLALEPCRRAELTARA